MAVYVGVGDAVFVDVGVFVLVNVMDIVFVTDGVSVRVAVIVAVYVNVYVCVWVYVYVDVSVLVNVEVNVLVGVLVLVNVYVEVYVNVGEFAFGVGVGVLVGVIVNVGDTHITLNTVWFENTAAGPPAPVPAIPPTFVKLWPHAEVVAHHVYEPDWSLILPSAQLTRGLVVPAPGFDPEYVKPVGTVSNNVVFAETLTLYVKKLLYES